MADDSSFDHFRAGEPPPGMDPADDPSSFDHFRAGEPYPDLVSTAASASLIKTFLGVLRASTKTVLTVPQTTNVKTWAGVQNQ